MSGCSGKQNSDTIIITGLSGAGKNTAIKAFEDIGYYCVDNLPFFLLAQLRSQMTGRLALVMDARDQSLLPALKTEFIQFRQQCRQLTILFLEADEQTLIRRFSQMRRPHPLACGRTLRDGIAAERDLLSALREMADQVIDTSSLNPHELRSEIIRNHGGDLITGNLRVTLVSFGFKYGLPSDADMLFDARFLPNPYFDPELKHYTGLDYRVADYVLANDDAVSYLQQLLDMLVFLIPRYRREGKAYLTICVGCTGGRHRSVALVERLARLFEEAGETAWVSHRDISRQ